MAACMNVSLPAIPSVSVPFAPLSSSISADIMRREPREDAALSYIYLSAQLATVGQTLNISWLVSRPTDAADWLGLYPLSASQPFEYLEFKKRGPSVQKAGMLRWRINPESFSDPETECQFRYYSSGSELLASSDVITVVHPENQLPLGHNMHISDIAVREFALPLNELHVLYLDIKRGHIPLCKILLLKTSLGGEVSWRSDLIHNLSANPGDSLAIEALALDNAELDTYKLLGKVSLSLATHFTPGETKKLALDLKLEQKRLGRIFFTLFFVKLANQSPLSETQPNIPYSKSVSQPVSTTHATREPLRQVSHPCDHSVSLETLKLDFTPHTCATCATSATGSATSLEYKDILSPLTPPNIATGLTEEFNLAIHNLKYPLYTSGAVALTPLEPACAAERLRYEQRALSRCRSNRSLDLSGEDRSLEDSTEATPVHRGEESDRKRSVLSLGSLPFSRDSVRDLLSSLPRWGSFRKRRTPLGGTQGVDPLVRDNPGARFLLRRDLYPYLERRGLSSHLSGDLKLLAVTQEVRHNPNTYLKWHRCSLLITFLNSIADTSADIPKDWEMKISKSKERVFVNHEQRFVTFVDPRLPLRGQDILPRTQEGIPQKVRNNRTIAGAATEELELELEPYPGELEPSERLIAFLRRDDIFSVVSDVMGEFATPELRGIIREVGNRGQDGLERHQNSEVLAHFLSMVDQEIEVYNPGQVRRGQGDRGARGAADTLPLKNTEKGQFMKKANKFWSELQDKGYDHSWDTLTFCLNRDTFLTTAFSELMQTPALNLRRRHIRVTFDMEEGIDEGGLIKEFFFYLSHELFNPMYGLFEYAADGSYNVQIQKSSVGVRNWELWFRFAGRLIGLAIVQQQLMDVFFSRAITKPILGDPFVLNDLEAVDPGMYRSLRYVLANGDTEDLYLTFSCQEQLPFGEVRTINLVKDGQLIAVTNRNKQRYVELMVKNRMSHDIERQTNALVTGVREIVPVKMLKRFDATELEWLISGSVEIDLSDWKDNTLYSSGISEQNPVVRHFWRAVEEFDNEDRLRLLQFITGSSSIPLNGFQGLTSTHGHVQRFTIRLIFGDGLPESHTCFNRLDIPRYATYDELKSKLQFAIRNTQGFNIA